MKSLMGDLTKDLFDFILHECDKNKNKKKITSIINNITNAALNNIKPYLYTIMSILVLLFLMNCFQFYYYIKLFILNNKSLNIDDITFDNVKV